jgi:Rieske Fe-S protein
MSITRRGFLQRTAAGGAVLVGGVTLPGCGNDVGAPPRIEAQVQNDITEAASFSTVRLSLAAVPDLLLVPSAVTVRLAPADPMQPMPASVPNPPELLVVHRGQIGVDDEWIAVDSACPHAGCPLSYSAEGDHLACPCHSSQFRAAVAGPSTCVGEVMHEPARSNVRAYQVALDPRDPKTLVIDLRVINDCGTLRLPPIVGGKLTLAIADYPALAQPGGSVIGRPVGSPKAIAVVRVGAGSDAAAVVAVSAVCTHLGCTVAYSDASAMTSCGSVPGGGFWCPCHCSEFALDGKVLVGPATQSLPSYGVAFDGTTLTITIV